MFSVNIRDPRPLYEQICISVKRAINAGLLQPGEKLPSVRELAAELAINPNTIQRAYRMLEADGWIVSAAGRGSFACNIPEAERLRKAELFDALSFAVSALLEAGVSMNEIRDFILKGDDSDA